MLFAVQHGVARPQGDVFQRPLDAIGGLADDGNVIRLCAYQPRKKAARLVWEREKVRRAHLPGLRFAAYTLLPGRCRRSQKRRHLGAIKVGDVLRDVE